MAKCAALVGLIMAAACLLPLRAAGAGAPVGNPTTISPTFPMPYSWPGFHAGGTAAYQYDLAWTTDPGYFSAPYFLPWSIGNTAQLTTFGPYLDPVYSAQNQGTPTAVVPNDPATQPYAGGADSLGVSQVDSFLLGNYLPNEGPEITASDFASGGLTYFADHFRDEANQFSTIGTTTTALDQGIFSWSAPYTYLTPPASGNTAIVCDDTDTSSQTYGVLSGEQKPYAIPTLWSVKAGYTGAWQTGQSSPSASYSYVGAWNAGTAYTPTNTYSRVLAVYGTSAAQATATFTWKFTAPGITGGVISVPALYNVLFHLPLPVQASGGTGIETRIPDAHYVINVTDAGTTTTVFDGRISQTETNDPQFLAGPFLLNPTDVVTVTLDNTSASITSASSNVYVLADSVMLSQGDFSNDVQSSVTSVNYTEYPEIQNAFYYGTENAAQMTALGQTVNTTPAGTPDPTPAPDGNAVYKGAYGNTQILAPSTLVQLDANTNLPQPVIPTYANGGPIDNKHAIRQLCYFGRSETIILMDAYGNLVDEYGNAVTTPVAQQVGAIYCVDGDTGSVVWRYQTPAILTHDTNAASQPNGMLDDGTTIAYPSAPVFSTPVVTRMNVAVYPGLGYGAPGANGANGKTGAAGTPIVLTKLVVIVADNNGMVYCLDALGNRNGTANLNAVQLDPTTQQPLYNQPVYNQGIDNPAAGLFEDSNTQTAPQYEAALGYGSVTTEAGTGNIPNHVGNTNVYWIWRPDSSQPFQQPKASTPVVKAPDTDSDLPEPLEFNTASAAVYVDPAQYMDIDTTQQNYAGTPGETLVDNGYVYIGNSNGVLYELNGTGEHANTTLGESDELYDITAGGANPYQDTFDVSELIGYRPNYTPATGSPPAGTVTSKPYPLTVNTPTANWWFAVNGGSTPQRGVTAGTSYLSIFSAPTIEDMESYATTTPPTTVPAATEATPQRDPEVKIWFTAGNYNENVGRLYDVADLATYAPNTAPPPSTGPVLPLPVGPTDPALPATTPFYPGVGDFNLNARPIWSFPNAYTNIGTGRIANALGFMSGSPVIFDNPDYFGSATVSEFRVYFTADVGAEGPPSTTPVEAPATTGRIWAVDMIKNATAGLNSTEEHTTDWAFPDTFDPNTVALLTASSKTLEGNSTAATPIGAFYNATPAIGMVEFPSQIVDGYAGNGRNYVHGDPLRTGNTGTAFGNSTGVDGQNVPMLYVGSQTESTDVSASDFYELDIDGTSDDERNIFYDANNPSYTTAANIPLGMTPAGVGWASSPLLLTNYASTAGNVSGDGTFGNGGVLFASGQDNYLYELSATPVSDDVTTLENTNGNTSNTPQWPVFAEYSGFGPTSSLSVSAFDVSDLAAAGGTYENTDHTDTDWVYGGDSVTGFARGITPANRTNSGGDGVDEIAPPPDEAGPQPAQLQFPLHTYVFDGTTAHPGNTANMANANNIGSATPAFEWGQALYFRISNVVPPVPGILPVTTTIDLATDTTLPSNFASNLVADPTDPTHVYAFGGPLTLTLTSLAATGGQQSAAADQQDTVTIPAILLSSLESSATSPNPLDSAPSTPYTAIPTGFTYEDAVGNQDTDGEQLLDGGGTGTHMWIAAGTYYIGDGSNRYNTPGSRRRITVGTQTAYEYTLTGNLTTGTLTYVGQVTLRVSTDSSANAYTNSTGGITRIAPVNQPTFAILNPLAVRGGGVPLALGTATPASAQLIGAYTALGPFGGVSATPTPTDDYPASSNGNSVYTSTLPDSGVTSGTTAQPTPTYEPVITATGEIDHNSSGDNEDTTHNKAPVPPTNNNGTGTGPGAGYGYVPNGTNGPVFGNYTLDVADRSQLGLNGDAIQNLRMDQADLQWNDNTALAFPNSTQVNGPAARVNPLPWEDNPTSGGGNTSVDYPNITKQHLSETLFPNGSSSRPAASSGSGSTAPVPPATGGGTLTSAAVSLDSATPNGSSAARLVYPDPVQVSVAVPQFQPPNLQLYDSAPNALLNPKVNGPITPYGIKPADPTYPMGYTAVLHVFVDSGRPHNGTWNSKDAYRDVYVYTGVPADFNVTIDGPTTADLGALPQSFGVQTDGLTANVGKATPLGQFTPFQVSSSTGFGDASPFEIYYRPLTIHNDGNVNWLNIHLDQLMDHFDGSGNTSNPWTALPLVSDAQDGNATIPAYDTQDVTGPRTASADGILQRPFLLRSNLDTDLTYPALAGGLGGAGLAVNPGLAAVGTVDPVLSAQYLGATFHKARVGDGQPSQLFVPDVPHDNYAYATTTGTGGAATTTVTNNYYVPKANLPMIGLAIPQGTPVGTYSQSVRVFEGMDPTGYPTVLNPNGYFSPFYPPKYGGLDLGLDFDQSGNTPAPYTGSGSSLPFTEAWAVPYVNNVATPLQPYSTPTIVKATVTENRLTDGPSAGALPQVDAQPMPVGSGGSSDYSPSGFRNLWWLDGTVNGATNADFADNVFYWTSSRDYTAGPGPSATPPFNIFGEVEKYVGAPHGNTAVPGSLNTAYFQPSGTQWFSPLSLDAGATLDAFFDPTKGINMGLSVAQEQELFDGTLQSPNGYVSDGHVYAFVHNIDEAVASATPTTRTYDNRIYCLPVITATSGSVGDLDATVPAVGSAPLFGVHDNTTDPNSAEEPYLVTNDLATPKFGVKALKTNPGIKFADAYALLNCQPNGQPASAGSPATQPFAQDLWAFWAGGVRGRSALYFSSAVTSGGTIQEDSTDYTQQNATGSTKQYYYWLPNAALPIPAGLTSVSDPSPLLVTAPFISWDTAATPRTDVHSAQVTQIPAIEVTYTGVGLDGNADIYVSRYDPYQYTATTATGISNLKSLAIMPMPPITELLTEDTSGWWDARDVGWARTDQPDPTAPAAGYQNIMGSLNVYVNGTPILRPPSPVSTTPYTPYEQTDLIAGIQEHFDEATDTLVYSNVSLKGAIGGAPFATVYIDLGRGRVRFSVPLPNNGPQTAAVVFATFQPEARRISTDPRADTEPVSLIDEAYSENEAGFNNYVNNNTLSQVARIKTDRYWYIWRKSGAAGAATSSGLWYKTQRLTIYLHDQNNNPISILLNNALTPSDLKVYDVTQSATLFDATSPSTALVDVDWARGRIYFPMGFEGDVIKVTGTAASGQPIGTKDAVGNYEIYDTVQWMDEPHYNQTNVAPSGGNPTTTTNAGGTTSSTVGANGQVSPEAYTTSESQIPVSIGANEGTVNAFLDPMVYADLRSGSTDPLGNNPSNQLKYDRTTGAMVYDQPHKIWLYWNSTRNGTPDIFSETFEPRFAPYAPHQ